MIICYFRRQFIGFAGQNKNKIKANNFENFKFGDNSLIQFDKYIPSETDKNDTLDVYWDTVARLFMIGNASNLDFEHIGGDYKTQALPLFLI